MAAAKRTGRTPQRARARKTPDWAPRFLAAFEQSQMVSEACKQASVGRSTVYDRRDADPAFAQAWADVEQRTTDILEAAAIKQAVAGSERLLIFMLTSRRRDIYGERVQHTGPGDGPVEHTVAVDPESRKLIDALLARRADARP